ncbi:MAG: hypothetical protein ABJE95_24230 [Byssovorax sp.]
MDKGRLGLVVTAMAKVRGEQAEVIEADGAARTVTLVEPARVKLPCDVKAPGPTKRSAAPAVVLGLLAATGISSGIGLMTLSSSKGSDADAISSMITAQHGACVSRWGSFQPIPCANLEEKLKERILFHNVAVGAFIGGEAAAAGTAIYLLWPSPRAKTMQHAAAHDLRLTPILGPTVGGVLVSGSF